MSQLVGFIRGDGGSREVRSDMLPVVSRVHSVDDATKFLQLTVNPDNTWVLEQWYGLDGPSIVLNEGELA